MAVRPVADRVFHLCTKTLRVKLAKDPKHSRALSFSSAFELETFETLWLFSVRVFQIVNSAFHICIYAPVTKR